MIRPLLALVAGLVIGFSSYVGFAGASDPPAICCGQVNSDLFQYQGQDLQRYSADSLALQQTGEWRWRFEANPSCSGDISRAVFAAVSSQAQAFAINFIYDASLSSHRVYANCGPDFAAVCGGPPVIGCLGRGFPYDQDIDISTDMAAYFDVSQLAIVLHENFHALGVWNEQYQLNGTFAATPGLVDVMNTGPDSRHDLDSDCCAKGRWARTMGPKSLRFYGMGRNGGGLFVFGCQPDAKATRFSVLYSDNGGPTYWAGILVTDLRTDNNGCVPGSFVEERAGRCYYLKQESAVSWSVSFTEVLAGCT